MTKTGKRVLIAPLDWGLGHATRCVPVINAFLAAGAEVILAADGNPFHFLQQEFPQLEIIRLRGYDITYPASHRLAAHLLLSFPRIRSRIREEHEAIRKIVSEKKIDIVVSDNRFGLYGSGAYSIYITHQLRVKTRSGGAIATRIHRSYVNRYDEVWIPDTASSENNLSGELAHPLPYPLKKFSYIGPLSRFSSASTENIHSDYQFLIMLSGPEPQRSIFETEIIRQFAGITQNTLLLRGKPSGENISSPFPNLTILPHLPSEIMAAILASKPVVLSRSGYSTLCDLSFFGNKLIAVPTPGQPEQEYLARLHQAKGKLISGSQENFDLKKFLSEAETMNGIFSIPAPELRNDVLRNRISDLLSGI